MELVDPYIDQHFAFNFVLSLSFTNPSIKIHSIGSWHVVVAFDLKSKETDGWNSRIILKTKDKDNADRITAGLSSKLNRHIHKEVTHES